MKNQEVPMPCALCGFQAKVTRFDEHYCPNHRCAMRRSNVQPTLDGWNSLQSAISAHTEEAVKEGKSEVAKAAARAMEDVLAGIDRDIASAVSEATTPLVEALRTGRDVMALCAATGDTVSCESVRDQLDKIIALAPTEEPSPSGGKCPSCDGTGILNREAIGNVGPRCPECSGEGGGA